MLGAVLPIFFRSQPLMVHPDAKVEKVYFYPNPVDFRKTIDGLAGRPRRAGYLGWELGQYFRVYQQAS